MHTRIYTSTSLMNWTDKTKEPLAFPTGKWIRMHKLSLALPCEKPLQSPKLTFLDILVVHMTKVLITFPCGVVSNFFSHQTGQGDHWLGKKCWSFWGKFSTFENWALILPWYFLLNGHPILGLNLYSSWKQGIINSWPNITQSCCPLWQLVGDVRTHYTSLDLISADSPLRVKKRISQCLERIVANPVYYLVMYRFAT